MSVDSLDSMASWLILNKWTALVRNYCRCVTRNWLQGRLRSHWSILDELVASYWWSFFVWDIVVRLWKVLISSDFAYHIPYSAVLNFCGCYTIAIIVICRCEEYLRREWCLLGPFSSCTGLQIGFFGSIHLVQGSMLRSSFACNTLACKPNCLFLFLQSTTFWCVAPEI